MVGQNFFRFSSCGVGLFNVVEGIIDHPILGLHHVQEYALDHLPGDMAFLAFGVVLLLIGWLFIRAGKDSASVLD